MVKIVLIIALGLGSLLGFSQETTTNNTFNVEATVNNIKSNDGQVIYALYSSEEEMTTRNPSQYLSSIIENGTSKIVFEDLVKGTYAIICYHDENGNNTLDFGDMGPIESYGTSNNVINRYGPPTFVDCKFEVSNTNLTFEIKF